MPNLSSSTGVLNELGSSVKVTMYKKVETRLRQLLVKYNSRKVNNQSKKAKISQRPTNNNGSNRQLSETVGVPFKVEILLKMPDVDQRTKLEHGWNDQDTSYNIYLKEGDPLVLHREPVSQSTDCIRGKVGYTEGIHAWLVTWPKHQRGTNAVVGVATKDAPLNCMGYRSLVGSTKHSWGWDIGRNQLLHCGLAKLAKYPDIPKMNGNFEIPNEIVVVLDMDEGSLSFVIDGQYIGVAHSGLSGKALYPIISSVWGNCEIGLQYIRGLNPGPFSLKSLCRRVVGQRLESQQELAIKALPVSRSLKNYLSYYYD